MSSSGIAPALPSMWRPVLGRFGVSSGLREGSGASALYSHRGQSADGVDLGGVLFEHRFGFEYPEEPLDRSGFMLLDGLPFHIQHSGCLLGA
jgi:hypothetical protein